MICDRRTDENFADLSLVHGHFLEFQACAEIHSQKGGLASAGSFDNRRDAA